jgi:SagB-type dehydrogenase family enzyme
VTAVPGDEVAPEPDDGRAPAPFAGATLAGFAYELRGAWPAPRGAGPDPGPDPGPDLAEEFHEASKIAAAFPGQSLGPAGPLLATEPDAAFALGRKALATAGPAYRLPPAAPLPVDLTEVTARRRSALPERAGPLPLASLGTVLALSTGTVPGRPGYRAVPSAGALYPLDVVVLALDVTGLPPGGYVYEPVAHALLPRGELDPVAVHTAAGTGAPPPRPSVLLAVVATFARTRAKYGLRGYRFALIEAGHVVQAAGTAATALGLAGLPWGGFADAEVDRRLDLDGLERSCVYLLALSAPRPAPVPTTGTAPEGAA